jgi:DNA ligase-1
MLFADIAVTSAAVTVTSGRRAKVELLATALRALGETGDPHTIEAGAAYLAGELRQRQIGVGWASLRELAQPAELPTLTVREVDVRLAEMGQLAGSGSQAKRRALVQALFGAATADEQRLLVGIISGEVRQGAQAGLLVDAIASAAAVPPVAVRRALLLSGDFKTVAVAALTGAEAALAEFRLTIGRPLAPMLAQAAGSIEEALAATAAPAAVDAKLDGIRVQVHRDGDDIAVFSRSLDDITARVPEIVAAVRTLPSRALVLDGEALAVDSTGRALPFQETAGRAARQESGRLTPFFFDALHIDGVDLVDEPAGVRWAALDAAVPDTLRVARTLVESQAEAEAAFANALANGQEGVVIKSVRSLYDVGRRGSAWVKVKPRHTLDLVVLAAEWGHGRRRGWLSNLHLGARDPSGTVRALSVDRRGSVLGRHGTADEQGNHLAETEQGPSAGVEQGHPRTERGNGSTDHDHDGAGHGRGGAQHGRVDGAKHGHVGEGGHGHLAETEQADGHIDEADQPNFVMLGKTFKGLTDATLAWQTARLLELATDRGDWVVTVRPELVVEIAFDGVQSSTRYPGGVTLRFARVLRYREDKSAAEADTIDAVRALAHAAHRNNPSAAAQ